jgi:hypothetical protein
MTRVVLSARRNGTQVTSADSRIDPTNHQASATLSPAARELFARHDLLHDSLLSNAGTERGTSACGTSPASPPTPNTRLPGPAQASPMQRAEGVPSAGATPSLSSLATATAKTCDTLRERVAATQRKGDGEGEPRVPHTPPSTYAQSRHRARYQEMESFLAFDATPPRPASSLQVRSPLCQESARRPLDEEVERLRADLAAAEVRIESAEVRERAAKLAQADAEKAASRAEHASRSARLDLEELRGQLQAERAHAAAKEADRTERAGRARLEQVEIAAVRSQYRGKWEEAEQLRVELAQVKQELGRREAVFARRELEMRGVRSKAMAMVQALRHATDSLSAEHENARAVLRSQFEKLEESVQWRGLEETVG